MASLLDVSRVPGSLETLQGKLGNVLMSVEHFVPFMYKSHQGATREGAEVTE